MDPNKEIITYGQCRCCLAKGHHRDVMQEYYFNGIREIYYDMFTDCFNLFLANNTYLGSLICSTCIQRLRDATSFRMMVVSTERQFLDAAISTSIVTSTVDKGTVFVNVPVDEVTLEDRLDVKVERDAVKLELDEIDIDNGNYDSAFIVNDYSSDNEMVDGEKALLARFSKSAPSLPTRRTLADLCPDYVKHLDMLQNVKIAPKAIMRLLEDHDRIRSSYDPREYVTEKTGHVVNACTILENSNITPFRSKSRTGFPCFYCRSICENLDTLKDHTSKHKKGEIKRILKRYGVECLVVYADITDLKCILCNEGIPTINELKLHLVNVHKKKMHTKLTDRVIPFKLAANHIYECQICGFNFETFGAIERHMNIHYRNYVCKDCGTGFITKYRLKVHVKSMHIEGNYPCESCGKIFSTQQKLNNHVNSVHKMLKRFKCTKCPERFMEYFKRQKHMVIVHGVAPLQYKCNVCDKSFDRRYTLSRHMKRDHLEERDFQCEMCLYKCFTKNELRVHMVKHTGERIFECSVCKKSYARKKTLREHMRIHNNDRRFACAVCGQSFVQKCSLKGHLKTHHLEYSLQ